MKIHYSFFSLLVLFSLSACILSACIMKSGPVDGVGFSQTTNLQDLVGCYKNLGEVGADLGKEYPKNYLAEFLWPGADIPYSDINVIRVEMLSGDSLKVTGESDGRILLKGTFIEGEDFTLGAGKINIKNRFYGPGGPFIGVWHKFVVLGIDERGDGKSDEIKTFAGIAYTVIPLVGQEKVTTRFGRILDKKCS